MVTRLDYQLKAPVGVLPPGGRWQARLAVRRRDRPEPLPAADVRPRRGVPEDTVKQLTDRQRVLAPSARARIEADLEHRDQLRTEDRLERRHGGGARSRAARQAVQRDADLPAQRGQRRQAGVLVPLRLGTRSPAAARSATPCSPTPTTRAQVTAAGHAYAGAQAGCTGRCWATKGHRPCQQDRHGTYRCVVKDSSGQALHLLEPVPERQGAAAKGVHHLQGVLGGKSTVTPRSRLKVGYKPVMVH